MCFIIKEFEEFIEYIRLRIGVLYFRNLDIMVIFRYQSNCLKKKIFLEFSIVVKDQSNIGDI